MNQNRSNKRYSKDRDQNRKPRRRRRGNFNQKKEEEYTRPPPKRYAVIFFDNLAQAKENLEAIEQKSKACDQLNIVLKAEGPMDDEQLLQFGKLFAGEAWTLIHTRRVEEGWYDKPQ